MVDWTKSMTQTFEFYEVDPNTWADVRPLTNVKSCSIDRDLDSETQGSASFDITESVGECYIRVYLVTIQNGVTEKHPLGTFLVQTPSTGFDGKVKTVTMDAYTPLIELKENPPPIGYFIEKEAIIMDRAFMLAREHMRAPVVRTRDDSILTYDFVADTSDTWLSFLIDLIYNANYSFSLDEMGTVMFAPKQDTVSLQPIWTYTDDNSSILYPDFDIDHDLFGVPNVVEVVYSDDHSYYHSIAVNDDPNSPISTVNRGREITYRTENPELSLNPSEDKDFQTKLDDYTNQLLRDLSSLEYTISYTHGYCPVRVGDCVRLNYKRAGITDIKAKVISQSISCEPGCPVTETAVFTTKLWG